MGYKTVFFGLSCILFAYYIYIPLPENIEEFWKVRFIDVATKTSVLMATLLENMSLMKYEDLFRMMITFYSTKPVSDENITVIDTDFSNIPVRLYLPKRKSETQRPAVIYIHGGAFIAGSAKIQCYDSLNRFTADKLDAVVIAPDYRLAPQYPFPTAIEDCISVIKFFLQDKILAEYGVNPSRICISGDSSGGNLVAALTQMLQNDQEYINKIKAQVLFYPGLQAIDTLMPSYQKYEHGPFLSRNIAIRMAALYIAEDKKLTQEVLRNEHIPEGSRYLLKFVNWSDFLPEEYKKNHVYTERVLRKQNISYPAILDSRVSPLIVSDAQLQRLPLTYIVTCEHDILRDDGLIYVTRLRNAGVAVVHDHVKDGIHGALSLTMTPFYLQIGIRIRDKYVRWLKENL